MTNQSKIEFIERLKNRNKKLAINTIKWITDNERTIPYDIRRQLIKAVCSMAANYRAACRSRSKKEFYSKISIVVEEADETLFWLELIDDLTYNSILEQSLIKESNELLRIYSKARKRASLH